MSSRSKAYLMLALLFYPLSALAQVNKPSTSAPAEESEAPLIRPPELVDVVEAEYPPAALAAEHEADVLLQLTVDANGQVTHAEVVDSAGEEFDQAARSAVLRFRFTPAYRGETAVASRILYSYRFRLLAKPANVPQSELPEVRANAEPSIGQRVMPRAAAPAAPIEVVVRGRSRADALRESAEAVQVIEIEEVQRQTADLGEVLARSEGVGIRRDGGLGSSTRLSLNGLADDQIRFFLDGVPLELAGYPFGVANVPVNLVERVEIYRGVVPVRFGADALGGAVNLTTEETPKGTHGAASYQVGSFGTYRLTLGARHLNEPSGFFTRVGGFVDYAENDYAIDVKAPNSLGRPVPTRIRRFHDAYSAAGGNVEVGFIGQPWAKRLLLRAFITDYEKELQHNVVMTVPYGEVTYGETSKGASVHHDAYLGRGVTLDTLAGYTHTRATFFDVSPCVYDWFGRCGHEGPAGELGSQPLDRVHWTDSVFGRMNIGWLAAPTHALRVSIAPMFVTRTGDERREPTTAARDPLTAQRDLLTLVSGLEYEIDLFEDRLENIAFVKQYLQTVRSEEPRPGNVLRRHDRDTLRFGVGVGLRYRVVDWFYAKASYELATRLPRTDEIFGDAALIDANLELEPEKSHNVNIGAVIDAREWPNGSYRAEVNAFLREAERLIVPLGNDRFLRHENVFGARSLGIEAAAGWTAPGRYLSFDGNATYLNFRNTSDEGTFGNFVGDRIPHRPYFFTNGSAELRLADVAAARDEITLVWNTRYVHEFFRGWESIGLRESKQVVPAQLLHSLALTYFAQRALGVSSTFEVQNITDAASYDFIGVQRPGRAFYFKGTADF